jgi:hypothetical protein
MRLLASILCLLVLVASALAVSQKTLQGIHRYISAEKSSDSDLAQLSATGTMAGYFNYEDVWQIHSSLAKKFPDFVTPARSFGKTWLNDDMLTFKIGNSVKTDKKSAKFGILFNALHHAREQTSLTMLIMVLIENLRRIVHKDPMFNYINIEFIPVVNVDSKKAIDKNWQTPNWSQAKYIRKNRHSYGRCNNWTFGVDINRNYGYKFGYNAKGGGSNDPCDEDYRGPKPFSEPETLAMKHFIEASPHIKSSMNFHAYGDLMIYPYNYLKDNFNKVLGAEKPKLLSAFDYIEKHAPAPKGAIWGNASKAINYIANGEASDWMLHYHDIIAYSPEIGNHDKFSSHFYVADLKKNLPKIVKDFYPTIRFFVDMHKISFVLKKQTRQGNQLQIQLFYPGLTILKNSSIGFSLKNSNSDIKIQKMTIDLSDKPFAPRFVGRLAKVGAKVSGNGLAAVVNVELDRRQYLLFTVETSGRGEGVEYGVHVWTEGGLRVDGFSGKL